ncbi:ABC transporter substrate-binding protein [Streptomyces sp. NPDC050504]|uniref:ABC transporter substrate-binding protein n=1 Tax=Streptomyces sp. NPDC050504 TaxID=3365618 RepID=UPI0037A9355C
MKRSTLTGAAVTTAAALLALTACGDPDEDGGSGTQPAGARAGVTKTDVVGQIEKDEAAAALLPDEVRTSGTVRLATAISAPPTAYFPDAKGSEPVGLDIDLADAVGRVLGVKVDRQQATFDAILPALESGKYDAGTANFGVTKERLKTIDFVTYINDGQGFVARADNDALKQVTELDQLCGKSVGATAGTTFEGILNDNKKVCTDKGEKPYDVKVYADAGAGLISLQQGRVDVIMAAVNGLRYQAAQPAAKVKFLGQYHRIHVGFALKKGSPLAKPFQAAVNKLIADGTYQRILKKWDADGSAVKESRISPQPIPKG